MGSPQNDDNDIWRRYRNAKHTYQRVHRQQKNAFNEEEIQEFEEVGEFNYGAFWHFVNKKIYNKKRQMRLVRNDTGRII